MKAKTWKVKLGLRGKDVAFRIPKELVQRMKLKPKQKARMVLKKNGLLIVPIPG